MNYMYIKPFRGKRSPEPCTAPFGSLNAGVICRLCLCCWTYWRQVRNSMISKRARRGGGDRNVRHFYRVFVQNGIGAEVDRPIGTAQPLKRTL